METHDAPPTFSILDGKLVIQFGEKPINFLVLTRGQAESLGAAIMSGAQALPKTPTTDKIEVTARDGFFKKAFTKDNLLNSVTTIFSLGSFSIAAAIPSTVEQFSTPSTTALAVAILIGLATFFCADRFR